MLPLLLKLALQLLSLLFRIPLHWVLCNLQGMIPLSHQMSMFHRRIRSQLLFLLCSRLGSRRNSLSCRICCLRICSLRSLLPSPLCQCHIHYLCCIHLPFYDLAVCASVRCFTEVFFAHEVVVARRYFFFGSSFYSLWL